MAAGSPDSSAKPVGAIIETTGAHLNGSPAPKGATVHSGDVVQTDTSGALHLQLGSGQVLLSASSEASLERRGSLARVTLARGSATFSLPDPLRFELETPAGIVRGSGTHATAGRVVIFSPTEIVVTASKGELILDSDGEVYVIGQGQSYRIAIEPGSSAAGSTRTPHIDSRGRRKLFFFLLAGNGTFA